MMARPSLHGSRKLSCFDVMPVRGWNQCVKWVGALLDTIPSWRSHDVRYLISRGLPLHGFDQALYVADGRRSCIVCSLNTIEP